MVVVVTYSAMEAYRLQLKPFWPHVADDDCVLAYMYSPLDGAAHGDV